MLNPYVIIAALLTIAAAAGGGWWKGHHDASTACQSARLEAEKATLTAQIDEQRRQAAAAQQIAAAAERRRTEAEAAKSKIAQRIDTYEAELARRPADSRCSFSDDDIRSLPAYDAGGAAPGAAKPAKPAR
jgi:hypothetical protein